MGNPISVTELVRNFSDYLNRVTYRGERFTVLRGRRVVAELGPAPTGVSAKELPDVLRSLPHLTPDEAEAFERDIEDARARLSIEGVRDPWES